MTYAPTNFTTFGTSAYKAQIDANFAALTPGNAEIPVRNGALKLFQRGTSGTVTTGNSVIGPDGIYIVPVGATVTWAKGGGLQGFEQTLLLTGASSMTALSLAGRMESYDVAQFNSQQVTFQALIQNNTGATLTPSLTISHANAKDNWSASTIDENAVALQSIANGTSAVVAHTFTHAATVNGTQWSLNFGAALNSGSNTVNVVGIDMQVTPGASTGLNSMPPTPRFRPIALEYLHAQRFYNNSFPTGTTPAQNAGISGSYQFAQALAASATLNISPKFLFPMRMRTAPSVTIYNPSAANAQIHNSTRGTDFASSSTNNIDECGFNFIGTTPSGSSIGDICNIHFSASAEL